MKQTVTSYATVLLALSATPEMVADAQQIFCACPPLTEALCNPTIPETEKFAVIDRLFPEQMQIFLKVVCRHGEIDSILDIFTEYKELERQQKQCAHALLEYVTPLTEAQLTAMKKMICAKTGKPEVQLDIRQNPALLGGFLLRIGDNTYDRSIRQSILDLQKSLIRR